MNTFLATLIVLGARRGAGVARAPRSAGAAGVERQAGRGGNRDSARRAALARDRRRSRDAACCSGSPATNISLVTELRRSRNQSTPDPQRPTSNGSFGVGNWKLGVDAKCFWSRK